MGKASLGPGSASREGTGQLTLSHPSTGLRPRGLSICAFMFHSWECPRAILSLLNTDFHFLYFAVFALHRKPGAI